MIEEFAGVEAEDRGDAPAPERSGLASPPAPGAGRPRQVVISPPEHYAAHLHETSASAYLYCSMAGVFREVGPEAY
jgi:hypothetical protein